MVIKSYFGIDKNKSKPIISVNQEIYKQLRQKMDKTISEYSKRKETENSSTTL
jgi:glutamate dehydrogenase/leucine dehydrogenase